MGSITGISAAATECATATRGAGAARYAPCGAVGPAASTNTPLASILHLAAFDLLAQRIPASSRTKGLNVDCKPGSLTVPAVSEGRGRSDATDTGFLAPASMGRPRGSRLIEVYSAKLRRRLQCFNDAIHH